MPLAEPLPPGSPLQRERVAAHAQAAIASMGQHGVPPCPAFFTVWYSYHAGDNTMVRRVIDTYLSNGRAITPALLLEIHARFFDTQREARALSRTTERLVLATEQVTELVKDSGGQTARYGSVLGRFSEDLGQTGTDLTGALDRIIADTQTMVEHSARLGMRLEVSAQVIATLRNQLDDALREARTDALTGLPNRRAVEAAAQRLAEETQARGQPLAVIMLDIDRFKRINDRWGHPVGDAVLRRVAATLQDRLDPGAFCGRFGGEEFVVLLPRQGAPAAGATAEVLRQAVAAQTFSIRDTGRQLGTITLSAGGDAWSGRSLVTAAGPGRCRTLSGEAGRPEPDPVGRPALTVGCPRRQDQRRRSSRSKSAATIPAASAVRGSRGMAESRSRVTTGPAVKAGPDSAASALARLPARSARAARRSAVTTTCGSAAGAMPR
ncbi:GGDEF domain-containing protein [Paeniroseomonas aquatica]|uniref:GGDEF domain-containing protein n=1 Tax=Paeniroseomonas aquatica TaxID=373043 RepID=UPI0036235953